MSKEMIMVVINIVALVLYGLVSGYYRKDDLINTLTWLILGTSTTVIGICLDMSWVFDIFIFLLVGDVFIITAGYYIGILLYNIKDYIIWYKSPAARIRRWYVRGLKKYPDEAKRISFTSNQSGGYDGDE